MSSEILWGHRFVNMMDYDPQTRDYLVDYDLFDETEEVREVKREKLFHGIIL